MKKFLIILIITIILFNLVACSENSKITPNNDHNSTSPQSNSTLSESNSQVEETENSKDLTNWGVEDMVTTDDGENIDYYYLCLPRYTGSFHMYSKISEQLDDTVVLLAGQNLGKPDVENVSNIFVDYTNFTLESMQTMYGVQSSNFKISIDSSEAVTVGDYEMYTHKGIITYDFDGTQRQHQYVAYATKLKDSGNCAYWMVYDISKDQSKGDLIAEHALNMAKTFREED